MRPTTPSTPFLVLVCTLVLALATAAVATPPAQITMQGRLTDGSGTPVADGPQQVTFRLYDEASGTAPALWTSTREVTTSEGVFSVVLGESTPLALAFDVPYWIGLQVEGEPAEMTPRLALTSSPYALGVADGAAVTALNGQTGAIDLIAGANVTIEPVPDGGLRISTDGGQADGDWTISGDDLLAAVPGNVGIATPAAPEARLHVGGALQLGQTGAGDGGLLRVHTQPGSLSPGFEVFPFSDQGTDLHLNHLDGSELLVSGPDFAGEPFLALYEDQESARLRFQQQALSVTGTGSEIWLDGGVDGDAAATLPLGAVSSLERSDEPGLAAAYDDLATIDNGTGVNAVVSRTITTPGPGFVIAIASADAVAANVSGLGSQLRYAISDDPTLLGSSFNFVNISASMAQLSPPNQALATQAVFAATGGAQTLHVVMEARLSGSWFVGATRLTLIYVPTAYGTVTDSEAIEDLLGGGVRDPQVGVDTAPNTPQAIAAEQAAARAQQDARIAAELADLRARLTALEAALPTGSRQR
jgi:hypothetical protein